MIVSANRFTGQTRRSLWAVGFVHQITKKMHRTTAQGSVWSSPALSRDSDAADGSSIKTLAAACQICSLTSNNRAGCPPRGLFFVRRHTPYLSHLPEKSAHCLLLDQLHECVMRRSKVNLGSTSEAVRVVPSGFRSSRSRSSGGPRSAKRDG